MKELQSLLGHINSCGEYPPTLAKGAATLHNLLKEQEKKSNSKIQHMLGQIWPL